MKKYVYSLIAILSIIIMPYYVKADDAYFNTGDNIASNGEYNHSYFEAGNNVKSNAKVNGISFVLGNSVNLKGKSEYAFIAGENIDLESIIEKDAFIAGNNIRISKDANLSRDAYIAGNNVKISSNVNGNLFVAGSIVELDNITVNGDVHIASNTLNILDNVSISGKVYINEGSIINNKEQLHASDIEMYASNKIDFKTTVSDYVISILATIFTGIVLSIIIPKVFKNINYELSLEDVCKKSLFGITTLLILPMLALLSFAIVVGVSVGVIILILYVASIMLSTIFTSAIVGHNLYTKCFKQKENIYASIVIGIVAIKLIGLIPIIGPLVSVIVFFFGLGVIAKLFLELRK